MQVKAEPATVAALTSEIMHGRSVTTFIAPSTSNQIDNVTRLAHLKAPVDLRDPTAYFDCVCEVRPYITTVTAAKLNPYTFMCFYRLLQTYIATKCMA